MMIKHNLGKFSLDKIGKFKKEIRKNIIDLDIASILINEDGGIYVNGQRCGLIKEDHIDIDRDRWITRDGNSLINGLETFPDEIKKQIDIIMKNFNFSLVKNFIDLSGWSCEDYEYEPAEIYGISEDELRRKALLTLVSVYGYSINSPDAQYFEVIDKGFKAIVVVDDLGIYLGLSFILEDVHAIDFMGPDD